MNRSDMKKLISIIALLALGFTVNGQTTSYSLSASYATNGVQVTLSDSYPVVSSNSGVAYNPYTFTNGLNSYSVNPLITNGVVRLKNVSPVSSPQTNYISLFGVGGTNNVLVYPGEVFQGRVSGAVLYGSPSNGTQNAAILWVPN
jgi:hypothetical protein